MKQLSFKEIDFEKNNVILSMWLNNHNVTDNESALNKIYLNVYYVSVCVSTGVIYITSIIRNEKSDNKEPIW